MNSTTINHGVFFAVLRREHKDQTGQVVLYVLQCYILNARHVMPPRMGPFKVGVQWLTPSE